MLYKLNHTVNTMTRLQFSSSYVFIQSLMRAFWVETRSLLETAFCYTINAIVIVGGFW